MQKIAGFFLLGCWLPYGCRLQLSGRRSGAQVVGHDAARNSLKGGHRCTSIKAAPDSLAKWID